MTDPRRWTTVVIPGTPPVEVVEASAYDEALARVTALEAEVDEARAELERFKREGPIGSPAPGYRCPKCGTRPLTPDEERTGILNADQEEERWAEQTA